MATCVYCGKHPDAGDKYCSNCGTAFPWAKQSEKDRRNAPGHEDKIYAGDRENADDPVEKGENV